MSHLLIRSVLFFFVTVSISRADILTLSSGETLDVSIVDQNDTSVHVVLCTCAVNRRQLASLQLMQTLNQDHLRTQVLVLF